MDTAPNKACIYQCHFWKNRPVFKAKKGVWRIHRKNTLRAILQGVQRPHTYKTDQFYMDFVRTWNNRLT